MGNIIKREWYLILRNKLFIIGFFLVFFLTVAMCYVYYEHYTMDAETDWTKERKDAILELEMILDEEDLDEESKSQTKKDIEVEQYCLSNGISQASWKANLIKYYLYKTAPDQLMQKAIDQAIDMDNWKIYYQYLDTTCQKVIEDAETLPSERLSAMVQLNLNQLLYKYDIIPEGISDRYQDWRNEVVYQYQDNLEILLASELMEGESEEYYLTDAMKKDLEKKQELLLYRLENNVALNREKGNAENIHNSQYIRYVAYVILILLFAQIFAQEFDRKTIQQTLFLPYKRETIYLSKLFAILQAACIYMILHFLVSICFVHILSGDKIYDQLIVWNHSIFSMNYYLYILIEHILGILEFLFIIIVMSWFTICGFSGSFVSMVGFVCCFLRFFLIYAANQYHLYFLKYIPLLWLDWQQYLDASPCIPGISMSMGMIGSLVFFGIFFATSLSMFLHKDF